MDVLVDDLDDFSKGKDLTKDIDSQLSPLIAQREALLKRIPKDKLLDRLGKIEDTIS